MIPHPTAGWYLVLYIIYLYLYLYINTRRMHDEHKPLISRFPWWRYTVTSEWKGTREATASWSCASSFTKTKRNFAMGNRPMLWGSESRTLWYPAIRKWKRIREDTAKWKLELGLARSRGLFCENETSRETNLARRDFSQTRVSHGLARIVTPRPPKTSFKTYFRHNNALIICLRQYSVLKIGHEFLARPGLRDETTVSRSLLASRLARSRSETEL